MQLSDRIGRRMKLQDLHVLMTVVQAGSMGKAARHLNTSQPNISKSIADLEDALGVCAYSIAIARASSQPNTAARCSIAACLYSTTCGRA